MIKTATAFFLVLTTVLVVHGQEQSGIPAKITAVNGKEFPVFLQGMEDDKVVFQLFKRPKNQLAPLAALAEIEFVAPIDIEGVEQLFSLGDYQGMILKLQSELKPSIEDYWSFMMVENNLQDVFTMLMKAYLRLGDVSKANKAASILLQNQNPVVQGQAESMSVLAALGEGRVTDAESLLAGVESEPGKLYLGACIEREKEQYTAAFQLTTQLIRNFGNDLSWMPQAELLNAHLYLDTGLTNSAMNTARQVMKIYKDSDVGNDAAKLHSEIVLAQQQYEADVRAREEAEAAEREAVRARAAERARGYGFNVDEETDEGTDDGLSEMETPDTMDEGSQ